MPPRREALRHSGGERRLFTSAMVTLYLDVELSKESRPGTEQNRSVGFTTQVPPERRKRQEGYVMTAQTAKIGFTHKPSQEDNVTHCMQCNPTVGQRAPTFSRSQATL